MTNYDVLRLGLILAIQAEIEGMKVANTIRASYDEAPVYVIDDFNKKAEELRNTAGMHDHQL